MEESKEVKHVKGRFEDERTNKYEYEVLYNNNTHTIEKVIALVMNESVKISMNQKIQKHILDTLDKENLSK
ncbi:hypothetical protein OAW17_04225 [Flavobacteriaceae bacterium]|nr:hypothetical protein [Flavobacteriaceae bacterium]MDC3354804.1 hypothetical protein [Flavobacteriaceae bacterium]